MISSRLFDIEVASSLSLGRRLKGPGHGGLHSGVVVLPLLTTGYVYVWRKGAFDWSG
jgi:NADH:ubiquinone oxidoreductase subunit 3 (subunit A)